MSKVIEAFRDRNICINCGESRSTKNWHVKLTNPSLGGLCVACALTLHPDRIKELFDVKSD